MKGKKVFVIFAVVMVFFLDIGCSRQEQHLLHADIIRGALTRLLTRPSGAFVIIEEPNSGKFIQFAGSEKEPLLLDLPSQTLTQDEMKKAVAVFSELGHQGPETYQTQDYPGGPPAGEQMSFVVTFGKDVDKATELAVAVLQRVYGFKEGTSLKLTEE